MMTIKVYDADMNYKDSHTGSKKNMLVVKRQLERLGYIVQITERT